MSPIKQSLVWWCYEDSGLAPQQIARAAAETGYAAVELIPPEHFALAKEHGLAIAAIQAHFPLQDGLNKRENAGWITALVQERIALAAEWNIPNLICFSGNRNGLDDETGKQITAENLRRLAPLAEAAGVMLILELLNSKVDHPDFQCDRTAWAVEVVQMVDSPAVKILYDIYHMQVMEGDIIATIRQHHPHFAHYHTAGVPGRHELDESQELYYPAIMRAIVETGYTGYVGQEFIPVGDPLAAIRQAYALCNV